MVGGGLAILTGLGIGGYTGYKFLEGHDDTRRTFEAFEGRVNAKLVERALGNRDLDGRSIRSTAAGKRDFEWGSKIRFQGCLVRTFHLTLSPFFAGERLISAHTVVIVGGWSEL